MSCARSKRADNPSQAAAPGTVHAITTIRHFLPVRLRSRCIAGGAGQPDHRRGSRAREGHRAGRPAHRARPRAGRRRRLQARCACARQLRHGRLCVRQQRVGRGRQRDPGCGRQRLRRRCLRASGCAWAGSAHHDGRHHAGRLRHRDPAGIRRRRGRADSL